MPLAHYFPQPYSAWGTDPQDQYLKHVTLRQILSHTSGFGNWDNIEDHIIRKLKFRPGERFHYSGEGYIYLQRIIEHICGQPLNFIIHQLILKPLGMNDSSYVWQPNFKARFAQGHGKRNDGLNDKFFEPYAAFSLYSTPNDYAKFVIGFLNSSRKNSGNIFESDIAYLMLSEQSRINHYCGWGLG